MKTKIIKNITRIKDPGSAITHFIAMVLAIAAMTPLLVKASQKSGHFLSLLIFILSMIGLYGASTIYQPDAAQTGPHDDFHSHRRNLHPRMHDCAG